MAGGRAGSRCRPEAVCSGLLAQQMPRLGHGQPCSSLPCCGTAASTGPWPQGGLLWNTTALEHDKCDPIASPTATVMPLCPVMALAGPQTQNEETVAPGLGCKSTLGIQSSCCAAVAPRSARERTARGNRQAAKDSVHQTRVLHRLLLLPLLRRPPATAGPQLGHSLPFQQLEVLQQLSKQHVSKASLLCPLRERHLL